MAKKPEKLEYDTPGIYYRDRIDLEGSNDGWLRAIWDLINERANWKPSIRQVGNRDIHIDRGEFLTSIVTLSELTSFTRRIIRSRLDILIRRGLLVSQPCHRGLKLKVVFYNETHAMKPRRRARAPKSSAIGENREAQYEAQQEAQQPDTYERINELKEGEGEGASAPKNPTPLKSEIIENGTGNGEVEKEHRQPEASEATQGRKRALAILWQGRCLRFDRTGDFRIELLEAKLDFYLRHYPIEELEVTFHHVENGSTTACAKYTDLLKGDLPSFDGKTIFQAAHSEAITFKKRAKDKTPAEKDAAQERVKKDAYERADEVRQKTQQSIKQSNETEMNEKVLKEIPSLAKFMKRVE